MPRRSLYQQDNQMYNTNQMFGPDLMFQGTQALSDRRHMLNRQRQQGAYMNRVNAGLEDPYAEEDMYVPQQNMLQNYITRQQQPQIQQQEQQQQNLDFGQEQNPLRRYLDIPTAYGKTNAPIDMNPQKSSLELLADQYSDYMMNATNPSNVQYNERKLPDGGLSYEEDPNNQYNKDRRVALADLKSLFSPQRNSSMRSTEDQLALDNNRAANAKSAIDAKYGYEMDKLNMSSANKAKLMALQSQLGVSDEVMNNAIKMVSTSKLSEVLTPDQIYNQVTKNIEKIKKDQLNGDPNAISAPVIQSFQNTASTNGMTQPQAQTSGTITAQNPQTTGTQTAGQGGVPEEGETTYQGKKYRVTIGEYGPEFTDDKGVRHIIKRNMQ